MTNIYQLRQIKEMAKSYQKYHPDIDIRTAVRKANEAYDIFRDAEFEIMAKLECKNEISL